MVVFLDLDEDDVSDNPHADRNESAGFASSLRQSQWRSKPVVTENGKSAVDLEERPSPNINGFSAALGCYPIVTQITAYIDLNTLHDLSRTCRQIRHNLLQYRRRLVQQTLRCENEAQNASLAAPEPGEQKWHIVGEPGHLARVKVRRCARDLVGECKRCGRIVCRNCRLKPPSNSRLPSRHRRLCPTCLAGPLDALTYDNTPARTPCNCVSTVHLCEPCGSINATADITYRRVWTWRTRYSTYLGGLGTGIGEGNEGVKCARGKDCLGAEGVEVEFECSSSGSVGGSGSESGGDGESPMGEKDEAGYWRQEIEGLGGIVKKKYRKRERVGGTVKEWEDERDGGEMLAREQEGLERSWCGWCGRVVLGVRDMEKAGDEA